MPKIDATGPRPAILLRISRFRSDPTIPWARLNHPHHLLLVIVGGRIRPWRGVQDEYTVPGDVVLYPPHLTYIQETDPQDPLDCLLVLFHWPDQPKDVPLVANDRHGVIRLLAERLETVFTLGVTANWQRLWDYLLQGLLAEFLLLGQLPEPNLVRRFRAYVMAHLAGRISLADLARHLGLNKFYLIRRYRQLAGTTPLAAVRRLRLEQAWQLVVSTDLPVKAIARQVGLGGPSHLSRLFRQQYRLSIRALRASRLTALGRPVG